MGEVAGGGREPCTLHDTTKTGWRHRMLISRLARSGWKSGTVLNVNCKRKNNTHMPLILAQNTLARTGVCQAEGGGVTRPREALGPRGRARRGARGGC